CSVLDSSRITRCRAMAMTRDVGDPSTRLPPRPLIPHLEPGAHLRLSRLNLRVVSLRLATDRIHQPGWIDCVSLARRDRAKAAVNRQMSAARDYRPLQNFRGWSAAGPLHVHGKIQNLGEDTLVFQCCKHAPNLAIEFFRCLQREQLDIDIGK